MPLDLSNQLLIDPPPFTLQPLNLLQCVLPTVQSSVDHNAAMPRGNMAGVLSEQPVITFQGLSEFTSRNVNRASD